MRAIGLMYHDVVPPGQPGASGFVHPWADHYKLDIDEFRRHLDALHASAARDAITTVDHADFGRTASPVFLTFDDGGLSARTIVAGWLEERGWRGHFLITTDWIGRPGFLDAAGLQDLRRRGHVVGSHSCSHPTRMAACGPAELRREWHESAARLSEILGEPVTTASVPGGYYSRAVAEAASAAGIRYLFTSEPTQSVRSINGCLVVGRYVLVTGTSATEAAGLASGPGWFRWRQRMLWTAKKTAKAVGGSWYVSARRRLGPPPRAR